MSSGIARYVLFCTIILVLSACVKPVDIRGFLDDEKVKKIIGDGIEIKIEVEPPEDNPPELSGFSGAGTADDPVIVSLGSTVTITVVNADNYDVIEWYYGSDLLGTEDSFEVDVGAPPFHEAGTYQLTVIGTTADGEPYDTGIFIKVVEG
jgi:hypothetical protein